MPQNKEDMLDAKKKKMFLTVCCERLNEKERMRGSEGEEERERERTRERENVCVCVCLVSFCECV